MEELLGQLLCAFIGCGIALYSCAIIMLIARSLDEKIKKWLTDRKLRKKFGDKCDQ